MTDNVVPFQRRRAEKAAGRAPGALHDESLHSRTRRAKPEARALAAAQSADDRRSYIGAAQRQSNERLIATGKVVPARITLAMNHGGHEGPDVDIACGTYEGNPAGDVDGWEVAESAPTAEQVRLMADLTGFPEAWFYLPLPPGPLVSGKGGEHGTIWLCGPRGCTLLPSDWVDERGVLHYGDSPDDERKPRTVVQGALPIPASPPKGRSPSKGASSSSRARTSRKKPNDGDQPLPTRMPEHLRAELASRLAEARKKRR